MITSKPSTAAYDAGWDRIFGKKPIVKQVVLPTPTVEEEVVDAAKLQRDADTKAWWAFCEKSPFIPTFDQFIHDRDAGKYETFTEEGSTPD
jgi:hypothetical protein